MEYKKVKDLEDSEIKLAVQCFGSMVKICGYLNVSYHTKSERRALSARIMKLFPKWEIEKNCGAKKVNTEMIRARAGVCHSYAQLAKLMGVSRTNKKVREAAINPKYDRVDALEDWELETAYKALEYVDEKELALSLRINLDNPKEREKFSKKLAELTTKVTHLHYIVGG